MTFINKCDILTKNKYGFRENKSTKDALTLISNVIYGKLDKSTPIAILFIDIWRNCLLSPVEKRQEISTRNPAEIPCNPRLRIVENWKVRWGWQTVNSNPPDVTLIVKHSTLLKLTEKWASAAHMARCMRR